jgi:hypothetical protein
MQFEKHGKIAKRRAEVPREKEGYRDQLEDIAKYFGEKRLLTVKDVGQYLGVDPRVARRRFGIDAKKGITTVELARRLVS